MNVLVSHRVLSMLLPLGSELVTALPKEPHLLPVFREFFHCCTVLAWRQADEGHLVLARAAVCWLPDCTNLVTTYKWKQNIEVSYTHGNVFCCSLQYNMQDIWLSKS